MEILLLFALFLGIGEIASEGVPQRTWSYQPPELVSYHRNRVPAMCENVIGEYRLTRPEDADNE